MSLVASVGSAREHQRMRGGTAEHGRNLSKQENKERVHHLPAEVSFRQLRIHTAEACIRFSVMFLGC